MKDDEVILGAVLVGAAGQRRGRRGAEERMTDAIATVIQAEIVEHTHDPGEDLVELWLRGLADRTRETYRAALVDFERVSAVPPVDLLRDHGRAHAVVLEYRARLLERSAAPATINVRLAALRSLVRHARRLGLAAWVLDVPGVKSTPYRETRGPGRGGFAQLLTATTATTKGTRDRAILWLAFGLGLRRAEIVSLDIEHVDLAGAAVLVLGKGQRERVRVTLSPEAHDALAAWLVVRRSDAGPVFTSCARNRPGGRRLDGRDVHRLVAALGRRAGLGRVRPHGLRHAAITAALDLGADLRAVQRFSRHADPRTLMKYDDARRDLGGDVARLVGASITAGGVAEAQEHSPE